MEFCPHCMMPAEGSFCGKCGGKLQWTAPETQLPLGTQLRGTTGAVYQIGAAKGQGGFGITYAAMDLMKGRRVAVKEYYPSRFATRDRNHQVLCTEDQQIAYRSGIKSFLEEAMMLSAVCALPSVVSVQDYFEANGTAYLVMEYVDGIPLHEVLRRSGPMHASELLPKLPKLLEDLEVMHNSGVIHRDISPDNLILMPDGSLKLIDFGAARSVEDGKSMTVLLKAGFSPVEQHQSQGQGAYSDVYALAATIYYCLTGVVPQDAISRLTEDKLESPNRHGADLTPAQEQALLWGMSVQPLQRPRSVRDFAQRLFPQGIPNSHQPPVQPDPVPAGQSVSGPVSVQPPLPQPPSRLNYLIQTRKPLILAGVAVGGFAALALFLLFLSAVMEALL